MTQSKQSQLTKRFWLLINEGSGKSQSDISSTMYQDINSWLHNLVGNLLSVHKM